MPIYDMKCVTCGRVEKDVFTRSWEEEVTCTSDGGKMEKIPARFFADVFPADGIFLEHVSPEGRLFHSKKEMKAYAKEHDLQLGALE